MTEKQHPLRKEHFEVLLEDINGKMGLLIEGHQSLTERIDRLEESFNQKLDERTAQIRGEILGVRQELKGDIERTRDELRDELRGDIERTRDELRDELRGDIERTRDELRDELKGDIERTGDELRDELKGDIEGAREELGQKIEKVGGKVSKALERLDEHEQRIIRIEEKVE